jgi:predicted RND superfamily exporter protein
MISEDQIPSNFTTFYNKNIESEKEKKLKIKFNNKIFHQSKLLNYFLNKTSLPKVEKETNDLLKKIKKNKKYVFSTKDIMMIESLKSDGVQILKKYDKLYEHKPNVPVEINSMIVNGETGLILLKIANIIGEDELDDIDLESLNFIVGILNELNTISLRNEILLKVLPLKV